MTPLEGGLIGEVTAREGCAVAGRDRGVVTQRYDLANAAAGEKETFRGFVLCGEAESEEKKEADKHHRANTFAEGCAQMSAPQ